MLKGWFLIFLLPGVSGNLLFAQTNTQTGWVASFNTFTLSSKWSVHFDAQARSSDNLNQLQTLIFRPGINFHLNKNQFISAGYAYVSNRFYSVEDNELLTEHRIWQQYLIVQRIAKIPIQHRFRFEQRFIPVPGLRELDLYATDANFSTRFRYFTRSVIPMYNKKSTFDHGFFGAVQNEIFLNTTNTQFVNGETFDQNRLYFALGYRIAKSFDIEGGYMWQYVNRSKDIKNTNNHIGQVAVYWRK